MGWPNAMGPSRDERFARAQYLSQRRPRLQQSSQMGTVSMEPGYIATDPTTGEPMLTARLNLAFASNYVCGEFPDELLRALHDMIARFIGIPQPPVQVQVQLSEPRRRRRARASTKVEVASVEAADPEKEAIKRRMLEGR